VYQVCILLVSFRSDLNLITELLVLSGSEVMFRIHKFSMVND
jgi:hypothetical protein